MRLSQSSYLAHVRADSARFHDVLAHCDPHADVPSCPEWTATDLLWHLIDVQSFWATLLRERPAGAETYSSPERPATYAAMLKLYDATARFLADELEGAPPGDEAWTWHHSDHTVGFILRRQAHEVLIHRLDAELTADEVTPLDPVLASDGVLECLEIMYGGLPPWGAFTPDDTTIRIDATDTDDQVWLALGRFTGTDPDDGVVRDEPDLSVIDPPGDASHEPALVIQGTAGDLDAWLWHRRDAAALQVAGDDAVHQRLMRLLQQPID